MFRLGEGVRSVNPADGKSGMVCREFCVVEKNNRGRIAERRTERANGGRVRERVHWRCRRGTQALKG